MFLITPWDVHFSSTKKRDVKVNSLQGTALGESKRACQKCWVPYLALHALFSPFLGLCYHPIASVTFTVEAELCRVVNTGLRWDCRNDSVNDLVCEIFESSTIFYFRHQQFLQDSSWCAQTFFFVKIFSGEIVCTQNYRVHTWRLLYPRLVKFQLSSENFIFFSAYDGQGNKVFCLQLYFFS